MHLKILLPYGIFTEQHEVKRIVADTLQGSYGILPNRLDCVGALAPGIFTYVTERGETHLAIGRGILVKAGPDVFVSVRDAIGGKELGKLQEAVKQKFLHLDERQREVQSVLIKLETRFIRQFQEFQRE